MSKFFSALLLATLLVCVHLEGVTVQLNRQRNNPEPNIDGFLPMAGTTTVHSLGNYRDISYYGNIGFGKDPSTGKVNYAPVVFDTGSAWLWVATTTCKCPGISSGIYVDLADTDFESSNKEITLSYGAGGGKGELGSMTVYLTDDLSFDHQLMIAMQETQGFGQGYSSGILGLSHKSGSDNVPTLLDNLFASGVIAQKLFTVALRNKQGDSEITFGEISHKYAVAGDDFTFVDLDLAGYNDYYYTFNVEEVKLGNTVSVSNFLAIADTGTSFICIPPNVADKFFKTEPFEQCVNNQGTYECDCDVTLPDLEFTIGGKLFTITSKDYLYDAGETCEVGILTITPPGGLIVLGDIFLRTVVGVFDLENQSIGFAHAIAE